MALNLIAEVKYDNLLTGKTADGAQWIGARNPIIEIFEYSDYQCPHCYLGHFSVRNIIKKHSKKVRLVHRHFPLRKHRFAFDYALMAVCAGEQGKYWKANDYLFANGQRSDPVTAEELAKMITINQDLLASCMDSQTSTKLVETDIAAGRTIQITGTPTFVIGGKKYPGKIPMRVIENH